MSEFETFCVCYISPCVGRELQRRKGEGENNNFKKLAIQSLSPRNHLLPSSDTLTVPPSPVQRLSFVLLGLQNLEY